MTTIDYVLVVDGSSDRALLPIIDWSLRRCGPEGLLLRSRDVVERRHRPIPDAVAEARDRYAPNLVFVHRDAEAVAWTVRAAEIADDLGVTRVVPVRMTEAWLLTDIGAIRRAAGNPNGREPLVLPDPRRLEALRDAKGALDGLLLQAAGSPTGRRLAQLRRDLPRRRHLVAEYTEEFSALDPLDAYRRFAEEVARLF